MIFLFIFLMITNLSLHASVYNCPETPIELKIGTYASKGWYVWPLYEDFDNKRKNQYLKLNKIYKISKWNAFPHGWNEGENASDKYFIACCRMPHDGGKTVCAYKNVREKNCKERVIDVKKDHFKCT